MVSHTLYLFILTTTLGLGSSADALPASAHLATEDCSLSLPDPGETVTQLGIETGTLTMGQPNEDGHATFTATSTEGQTQSGYMVDNGDGTYSVHDGGGNAIGTATLSIYRSRTGPGCGTTMKLVLAGWDPMDFFYDIHYGDGEVGPDIEPY